MLSGRAADVKRHKWFDGMDWEALSNRRIEPGRRPREDSAKRLKELMVRASVAWAVQMVWLKPRLAGSFLLAMGMCQLPTRAVCSSEGIASSEHMQHRGIPVARHD
jgi:hypothetical protein